MNKITARRGGPEALLAPAHIHLLCRGHTTATLARALGISTATAARLVARLRKRLAGEGLELVSVRRGKSWQYEVRGDEQAGRLWESDSLVKNLGCVKGSRRRGETVDDAVYGRG